MYVTKFGDILFVLHCFQKKTQKTNAADIETAITTIYRNFKRNSRHDQNDQTANRFENVWDAIEDTPALAENMKLRTTLMLALKDHIAREGLTQSEAAKIFGVTQPRSPTSCADASTSSPSTRW